MKKSFQIKRCINTDIEKGDKVFLTDGSALSCIEDNDGEYYIVMAYLSITGKEEQLKDILCEVIEVGVTDFICPGYLKAYMQDIVVQVGNAMFRTCSAFVKHQHTYVPYTILTP